MAPSYSLDNITFTTLTGAYLYGGRPRSYEEVNIELESDSGRDFIYPLSNKKVFETKFRVGDVALDVHETMHLAVMGGVEFYLSMSGAGVSDSILVRKMPGFNPQELDQPLGDEAGYDITHIFKQILP